MAYKTFEEVVEFNKTMEREDGCYYIYTCPSLYPNAIEFRYSEELWVRTWHRIDGHWVMFTETSCSIPIPAALDKEWEGFKLCYEKGN